MSTQRSGNVAVFWDYENCPAPTNTSGYAIANSISALACSFGSVKMFRAYQEISDQSRLSLRSELQSSGVSLVDCPHNGRKDVADKMILVDMLSYAIDNPAPSTIFLITGDRDFAYALSILKNRHYKVILVKRPDTHLSLTSQACICFDWFLDVIHQAENPSSQAEQRPQRPYQRHRLECPDISCNAAPSHPTPWHSAMEKPVGSGTDLEEAVDIVHFLRDRIPDQSSTALQEHPQVSTATDESPRQEVSSSPKRRRGLSFSTSRNSTSNPTLAQEKQQTSLKALVKHQITQPATPCVVLPPPIDDPPVIQDVPSVEPLLATPVSRSAGKGIASAHITKPTGTHPKLLEPTKDGVSSLSPLSSPFIWPAPALTTQNSIVAQRVVHDKTKPIVSLAVPRISTGGPAENFLKNGLTDNISPVSLVSNATSSLSPKPSTSGATADNVKPRIEFSVTPEPTDTTSVNPRSVSDGNDSRTSQTTSEPGQSTGLLGTPVVPPNFVALVEALQLQRSKGVLQPLRSTISERISKKGITYQKAGVTSFRQYSLLAEQAGIVDMGGHGGRDWIRLKPTWHGVQVAAPTMIAPSTS